MPAGKFPKAEIARQRKIVHASVDAAKVIERELERRLLRLDVLEKLVRDIQGALGTEEDGAALVEVARNAHRAEQELAAAIRHGEEE